MAVYELEKLNEDLYCIVETKSVNIYVIVGSEKALVIDNGYGYHDFKDIIRSITDKPIEAVVTHGDPDHALGSWMFDKVMIQPKDLKDLYSYDAPQFKKTAIDYRLTKMPELKGEIDEDFYINDTSIKGVEFIPIHEGDIIDLGNYKFKVLEIPGHSRGHIALFEETVGWMFTGDMISRHNIWNHQKFLEHCEPLSVFMKSYKKIYAMGDQIKAIYPAHNVKPIGIDIILEWEDTIRDLVANHQNDPLIQTFVGPAYFHKFGEREFLYTKEMLEEAIKNGVE